MPIEALTTLRAEAFEQSSNRLVAHVDTQLRVRNSYPFYKIQADNQVLNCPSGLEQESLGHPLAQLVHYSTMMGAEMVLPLFLSIRNRAWVGFSMATPRSMA